MERLLRMADFDQDQEEELESELEPLSDSTTESIDSTNEDIDQKLIEDTPLLYPYVCGDCMELNLTEQVHLGCCRQCREEYCVHNASTVDPSKCSNCLSKVTMTEQVVVKKSEHYDEEKDRTYFRTQKARQISFSGEDWLFYNRKISTLTDDELLLAVEFHHTIYGAMLRERDKRRSECFHRNAGRQFKINTSTVPVSGISSTETTVKKTRVIKPKENSMKDILQQLLNAGYTQDQIVGMLGMK